MKILLEKDSYVSLHQINFQVTTTEVFNVQNKMALAILNNIFKAKAMQQLGKMFGTFRTS